MSNTTQHWVVFDVIYVYIGISIKTQRDVLQEIRNTKMLEIDDQEYERVKEFK